MPLIIEPKKSIYKPALKTRRSVIFLILRKLFPLYITVTLILILFLGFNFFSTQKQFSYKPLYYNLRKKIINEIKAILPLHVELGGFEEEPHIAETDNEEILTADQKRLLNNLLIIFTFLTITAGFAKSFYSSIKNPPLRNNLAVAWPEIRLGKLNLANWLDFQVIEFYLKATAGNKRKALLYYIFNLPLTQFFLKRTGIDKQELKDRLKELNKSSTKSLVLDKTESPKKPLTLTNDLFLGDKKEGVKEGSALFNIIQMAVKSALILNHQRLTIGDFLFGLSIHDPFFSQIIFEHYLEPDDVLNIIYWYDKVFEEEERKKKFWLYENLIRNGAIGREWCYGYTPYLNLFASDITKSIREKGFPLHLIGHLDEIERIEQALAKTGENNVLLVGNPGVGRKTVVLGFAKKIIQGKSLKMLRGYRLVELSLETVIAGAKNSQEITSRFINILDQAVKAGNIIMVIDNLHEFISPEPGLAKVDISQVLLPYLKSPNFQIVGITDYEGLESHLKQNPSFLGSFEQIEIKEPNKNETILILEDAGQLIEKRVGVTLTYQAIKETVEKTDIYIQNVPQPEKALEILDLAVTSLATKFKERVLRPQHVNLAISQKTKIPVGKLEAKEKEKLLKLEELLHQQVINQEDALKVISQAMRRARTGIAKKDKPIGVFLFLGPTGVGKTQTAKALAEVYFGSKKRMIRLDMSEYQGVNAVERLIGSSSGKEGGYLIRAVEKDPFSLILFDEIEKTHPDVLNLFLQVFDEGHLTSGGGRTVSFKNTIIIATSNAGADLIRRESKNQSADFALFKEKLLDYLQTAGLFQPEFLNRFDAVVLFKTLTLEHTQKIAELMLKDLALRLKAKDMELVITPELVAKVAKLGYQPEFGARPMRRVIQDKVENIIALKMLREEIGRGSKITISPKEII